MAMAKMTVTPRVLKTVAGELKTLARNYTAQYEDLFRTTDGTNKHWNGDDNTAFCSQIRKYEADFREMVQALTSYAEHLETSAASYEATERAIAADASNLATKA